MADNNTTGAPSATPSDYLKIAQAEIDLKREQMRLEDERERARMAQEKQLALAQLDVQRAQSNWSIRDAADDILLSQQPGFGAEVLQSQPHRVDTKPSTGRALHQSRGMRLIAEPHQRRSAAAFGVAA